MESTISSMFCLRACEFSNWYLRPVTTTSSTLLEASSAAAVGSAHTGRDSIAAVATADTVANDWPRHFRTWRTWDATLGLNTTTNPPQKSVIPCNDSADIRSTQ